jgi:Family of unknown function (DUF6178)
MPKTAQRARRRQPRPEKTVHTNFRARLPLKGESHPPRNSLSRRSPKGEGGALVKAVPHLAPETLHALVRHKGLDAAADLVAVATPGQLRAVFDIDLWRPSPSGRDERFDADRFGEWVEALVDADEVLAARTIAALDEDLVITGLSRYVRVFDPAALLVPVSEDEAADLDLPSFTGLSREVGGFVVRARSTDAWDAIVTLLFALAEHHPDRFNDVMCGCRRLSNSRPEIDGLDDLLMEPEQILHDVAAERDRRRSLQGYVSAADARAFLQMARQRRNPGGVPGAVNPFLAAYFRAPAEEEEPLSTNPRDPVERTLSSDVDQRESFEALHALLEDAGLLTSRPRGLLPASQDDASRPARMEALLRHVADSNEIALAARSRELAFLANVLAAGCHVQARAFTADEASEAAIAICNLGLEHWPVPDSFLADNDLIAPFEAGWATLHELGMFVARQLIDILADLRSVDDEVQAGLDSLRSELLRECGNGTPWRVHTSLEVIAMLDMPVCVSLQALVAECPVLPDALTAILERRTRAISPTAFEFISTTRQIQKIREFAGTLLETLMR